MRGDLLGESRGRVQFIGYLTIRQAVAVFALAERDFDSNVSLVVRQALLDLLARRGIDIEQVEFRDYYAREVSERKPSDGQAQRHAVQVMHALYQGPVRIRDMVRLTALSRRAVYDILDNISEVVPLQSNGDGEWRIATPEAAEVGDE